ncbi:unnamed protein product, partial [Discosporangium mesarthrocarpum]
PRVRKEIAAQKTERERQGLGGATLVASTASGGLNGKNGTSGKGRQEQEAGAPGALNFALEDEPEEVIGIVNREPRAHELGLWEDTAKGGVEGGADPGAESVTIVQQAGKETGTGKGAWGMGVGVPEAGPRPAAQAGAGAAALGPGARAGGLPEQINREGYGVEHAEDLVRGQRDLKTSPGNAWAGAGAGLRAEGVTLTSFRDLEEVGVGLPSPGRGATDPGAKEENLGQRLGDAAVVSSRKSGQGSAAGPTTPQAGERMAALCAEQGSGTREGPLAGGPEPSQWQGE